MTYGKQAALTIAGRTRRSTQRAARAKALDPALLKRLKRRNA